MDGWGRGSHGFQDDAAPSSGSKRWAIWREQRLFGANGDTKSSMAPRSRLDPRGLRYLAPSWATQFYYGYVIECSDDNFDLNLGRIRPRKEIIIEARSGGRAGDFLWNDYLLHIASGRAIKEFDRNGFSGYSTYPVTITRRGKKLGNYRGVSVLGRAGPIDEKRSRAKRFKRNDGTQGGIRAIDGLQFDPRNWDGSDIFCLDDCNALLMVERVWRSLEADGLTNFRAKRLSEFGFGYPRFPRR